MLRFVKPHGSRLATSVGRQGYVGAAVVALRDFMDLNLAASKIELEAKLIESHFGNPPFEPDHLHEAQKTLIRSGELTLERAPTRGGGAPPIFVVADRVGRTRRVNDTFARKRLLMSRYYSYAQGTDSRPGMTGAAGEAAVQAALARASVGASLATVSYGIASVPNLFGEPVPIGPLDNGLLLQPMDPDTLTPVEPYGVHALIEVKNIREWVYPRTQELYQVLLKSALIQERHRNRLILPVLICRRAHFTTRKMAKALGFFVIAAKRHYLPAASSLIDPAALQELRVELGLADLSEGTDQTSEIENRLRTMQRYFDASTSVARWAENAKHPLFISLVRELHSESITNRRRDIALQQLRQWAEDIGREKGW